MDLSVDPGADQVQMPRNPPPQKYPEKKIGSKTAKSSSEYGSALRKTEREKILKKA